MKKRFFPLFLKTWLNFAIMTTIFLLLLWCFQLFFFNSSYEKKQEDYIRNISDELVENFEDNPHYYSKIQSFAKSNNYDIYIFRIDEGEIKGDSSGGYYFDENLDVIVCKPDSKTIVYKPVKNVLTWSAQRENEFIQNIIYSDFGSFFFVENSDLPSTFNFMVYGNLLMKSSSSSSVNQNFYFCLVAPILNSGYTVNILQKQLLLASLISLIISMFISVIFSREISKPINRLALTASTLAKGDFSVNFQGGSFKEVQILSDSLNFAKDEMSKTEQMRRDFIANISHDLRTPLTMIRAYAEMIRDLSGNTPAKRTQHCQIIIDEAERLSSLVADIQNLSKLQSGTEVFTPTTFDMSQLCRTVINRFGIMSEKNGYVFEFSAPPLQAYADYSKIEQVLYNLIGNACNYVGEDKKIIVGCEDVGNGIKVSVSDHGKGISPEDLSNVWIRFYRDNEKKRNIVGSGLGLNIVKMILDGQHFDYGVDSVVGKGTTFWFVATKPIDKTST